MSWECPRCNSVENDDATMRCTCGHELEVHEVINYEKIGGALYLVWAGLVLTPLINLMPLLEPNVPIEGFIIVSSFAFYVFLPIFMIVLLIKRKKVLRPIIICYYLLNFLVSLVVYYAVKSIPPPQGTQEALIHAKSGVLVAIIGCGIWVTYFLSSARAKRTLVK
jgi:hypothetical protein